MKNLLLAFAIAITLFSCSKDDGLNDNSTNTDNTSNQIYQTTITSSVLVSVKDVDGNLVTDAEVIIGDNSAYTENGYVSFNNIIENEDFVGVKVSKNGYVTAVKNFTPSTTKANTVAVTLFEGEIGTFSSSTGGTLTFNDNVQLDFPANSISTESGANFTGTAKVNLQYHHPDQDTYLASMPGALVGLDNNGNYSALATEGMLSVDLSDNSGNPLQIKEGYNVSVQLPADADSPNSILLWHLNENTGIWEETGTATKIGSYYEFEVSHFSSYNLDYTIDSIDEISITVTSGYDTLANQLLEVYVDGIPLQVITSDTNGQFTLLRAPEGNYQLKPLLCDGEVSSNTVNITTSGNYTIDVPDFSELTEINDYIQFRGGLYNCINYYEPGEVFEFVFFSGTENEHHEIIKPEQDGWFFRNVGFCNPFGELETVNIEVKYPANNFNGAITFENRGILEFENNYKLYVIDNDHYNICNPSAFSGIPIYIESNLYNVIKNYYALNENQVLNENVSSQMKRLFIWGLDENSPIESVNIEDITNYFPNLVILKIQDTEIENFSTISSLYYLKTLTLERNSISDISVLENLNQLEKLYLYGNPLTESQIDTLRAALPNCEIYF